MFSMISVWGNLIQLQSTLNLPRVQVVLAVLQNQYLLLAHQHHEHPLDQVDQDLLPHPTSSETRCYFNKNIHSNIAVLFYSAFA